MLYQICHGAVSFADEEILHDINFEIRNTEKIAVVGRNGCGKTTLLKLIHGDVELDKRDSDEDIFIAKAGNPQIGYLKQIAFEDPSVTLEQEVRKVFAPMERRKKELEAAAQALETDYSEEAVTRYTVMEEKFKEDGGYYFEKEYDVIIRKFGFSEEERKKPLSEFSGGQQTKIAFIKLLLSKPDILLLDEPTNHLDITSKEILENAIRNYTGTVLYVSHDRYFINQTATRIIELRDKQLTSYIGNYDYYETHRTYSTDLVSPFTPISGVSDAPAQTAPAVSQAKLSWQESKAEAARQRKKANDLKKLEASIEELENRIAEIDEQFLLPENATNVGLLNDLTKQRNEADTELNELYTKWEELSEED